MILHFRRILADEVAAYVRAGWRVVGATPFALDSWSVLAPVAVRS
jgi:hypothetical protein